MVNEIFDHYFLDTNEGVKISKSLFDNELVKFKLESEYQENAYWQLVYINDNIKILFGSGRGILEYWIEVDGKFVYLDKFEKKLKNQNIASSEKNIRYVFNVIKRYLEEYSLN